MSSRLRDPRRKEPRFPGAGRKDLQRRSPVPASVWSLRDKLTVGAGAAVALLAFFSPVILKIVGQRDLISRRLESWRAEYGLKEHQVRKLREIEYEFHGSGNPFFKSSPPTTPEIARHHKEVASAMGQGAGNRYIEKISWGNPRSGGHQ